MFCRFPNASQAQKLASLKFLGHWVGDIHQPLHVSFEDDRGGNGVLVTGECGASNLHAAWDTCLVVKAVGENTGEAATDLLKSISPAKMESWTSTKPMDWANEFSPSQSRRRRNTAFDRVRPAISQGGK